MSNLPIFDIAGSALQAQSVRMSTIASNLSNADTVAGSADAVYKPLDRSSRPSPARTIPTSPR
jgi:flagellar basal-body rod protein FlgC